ncbi:hypothetical protein SAMN05421824_0391 [Hyunsoonleella jejuensis]|uniref:Beta-carotene 15,15'-monooxygenase n=1 Tax=Hyunsoonleella jejuensis TaxID=419940 RepID=A0A1H9AXU1_9FLAO|nr:hypothetical protein [Hyunsoonleella jejuensis]SEP81590.1 hypothetical protein SAMN05421824_0391 [Hyunsoonleella jejuensis]
MITSIFNKSKPINFIIVFFIIAIACSISFFKIGNYAISFNNLLIVSVLFLFGYFSMLVLNFVSGKNNLTQTNNFEIVLYASFLLMVPQTTGSLKLLLANIFLLFSLRRLISLRSQKSIKKKLFDAAFWITLAAICYAWASVFLILIPVAVFLYTDNKLRNWLIPLTAIVAVLLIAYCICFFANYELTSHFINGFEISFDFSVYNTPQFLVALTLFFSFGLWSLLFYIKSINLKKKSLRPAFYLIIWTVIISFLLLIIAPEKSGGEFLFVFAPLAIIISSYIEVIREKWFKEVFFLVLLIVPVALLFL